MPDNLEIIRFKKSTIWTKVEDVTFKRRLYFGHEADEYLFLLDGFIDILIN